MTKPLVLGNSVVEIDLKKNEKFVLMCPHCKTVEMKHIITDRTHIYTCEECPNIMFEYSNRRNITALTKYLERNEREWHQTGHKDCPKCRTKDSVAVLRKLVTIIKSSVSYDRQERSADGYDYMYCCEKDGCDYSDVETADLTD